MANDTPPMCMQQILFKKNTDGTFLVFIWIYSIRNIWIVFFVDGDPENQFNINPEYGSILTSKRLDREKGTITI